MLLKVRTARRTSIASLSDVGGDGDAEDDDEESSEEEGIDSEESEEDEVNMSSSDVEDEQDGDDDDGDDDANLSLEELRSKYATLTRSKIMEEIIDRPSEETSPFVDTIKPSHTPNDQTAEGSDSEEMSVKNTDLEEEALASAYLSVAEIEEVDDILLDDEDTESVIMDSELDLSGSEYTDEGPGLLGLLGNAKEVAPKKELTTEEIQNGLEGDEVDADYRQSDSNDGSEVQKPYMSELTSVNDSVDAFHDHHTVEEAFGRVPAESSTQSSTTNGQTDLDIDTTPSSSPTQISAENAASALSQASVAKTPIPVLLRGQLREYQHLGLDWLANLYEAKNNGILADEMGLG